MYLAAISKLFASLVAYIHGGYDDFIIILDPVLTENDDLHVAVGHPPSDNLAESAKLKVTMQENVQTIRSRPSRALADGMLSATSEVRRYIRRHLSQLKKQENYIHGCNVLDGITSMGVRFVWGGGGFRPSLDLLSPASHRLN